MRSAKPRSRTAAAAPPDRAGSDLLFVYGSLMAGFPLHYLLAPVVTPVGPGRIAGRLVDLGAYPGAVRAPLGHVRGEVYRVDQPDAWATLDYAEGPQYPRDQVLVELDAGGTVSAFVYWYRGPLDRGVPIPAGDYRAHAPARSIHYTPRHPGGS